MLLVTLLGQESDAAPAFLRRLLLTFLITIYTSNSVIGKTFHYAPTIVQLTGKIALEEHYGPPNFGEDPNSDEKVVVPVLALDKPIDVDGDDQNPLNNDSFKDVWRIQLVFSQKIEFGRFVNQHVKVRGTLFEKQTGHHYTNVLLKVDELAPA